MAARKVVALADELVVDRVCACMDRMEGLTAALGPLLVSVVAFLVLGTFVFFMSVVLPFSYRGGLEERHMAAFWFSCWVMSNITFNYAMAAVSTPGVVPKGDFRNGATDINVTQCRHCKSPRPLRAHHCRMCKRCILKMDHHCPWINNCVGHYNHRYFVLFLVYLWGGCAYVAMHEWDLFWMCMSPSMAACRRATDSETLVLGTFVLVVGVLLGVGFLMGAQLLLISRGLTSIEDQDDPPAPYVKVRPFDLGFCANWRALFGVRRTRDWLFVLVPWPRDPLGDGYRWRQRASVAALDV